ncbi:hypothetical protein K435DRAFT_871160, partial [Dendrothele bispora CBS 962.96]
MSSEGISTGDTEDTSVKGDIEGEGSTENRAVLESSDSEVLNLFDPLELKSDSGDEERLGRFPKDFVEGV